MNYKDNIEWLKSLKQQIGKTQHCDLWHFEQVIDETIENLKPLAKPHGRLIDADTVEKRLQKYWYEEYPNQEASYHRAFMDSNACVKDLPTIIEAEVGEG